MKETEDQRIADKFRQVFEDYEDPSSESGWKELRKKYPESKIRPLFFWISSAAAIFLILSGLWLFKPGEDQEFKAVKNSPLVVPQRAEPDQELENLKIKSAVPANDQAIKKEVNVKPPEQFAAAARSAIPKTSSMEINSSPAFSQSSGKLTPANKDSVSLSENAITKLPESPDKQLINPDSMVLSIAKENQTDQNISKKNNELISPAEKKSRSEKGKNKNNMLSLYAGSFINYAEGSESNVNVGAGFSSDFKISKNLKISTGLNLSKNSLTYDQNAPANGYGSFQNSNPSGFGNLVAISNYQADLLSLDIPLNLKYLFNPEKNATYFLAGLSSGTYLSERYGVQYNNFNTLAGTAANQQQEIKRKLQDFDLMRTLNISFGFNTKLSKSQSLTIEPFVKYPLGGLGTENLKFGASGINVKLNFNTAKK